jgi:hypothetical protein
VGHVCGGKASCVRVVPFPLEHPDLQKLVRR